MAIYIDFAMKPIDTKRLASDRTVRRLAYTSMTQPRCCQDVVNLICFASMSVIATKKNLTSFDNDNNLDSTGLKMPAASLRERERNHPYRKSQPQH